MKNLTFFASLVFLLANCNGGGQIPEDIDYRQEMRDFVIELSNYGKSINSQFQVIPQNGIELVSDNGEETGPPNMAYLNAIDGHGQEDLFYGYDKDDKKTSDNENTYLRGFLDLSLSHSNTILVTDYCSTQSNVDDSYTLNAAADYIPFAADERELSSIPTYPSPIFSENNNQVNSLSEVENFLYLINPENYSTKAEFITAITATNYDLLIMDLFFGENESFSANEINQLKAKANGGKRLVIAYMSIGEAEDYRYYWQTDWKNNKPSWMDKENPNWKGNFKVKYWESGWQDIIYGNNDSYLKKILDAGFDGVYLDIIDAFEFYE